MNQNTSAPMYEYKAMNTQSLTHKYHSHHKHKTQCLEAFELGSRYLATKDVARAIRWYERAAAAGHTVAQYNLGLMYLKGEGVSRDAFKGLRSWWPSRSLMWCRRAHANVTQTQVCVRATSFVTTHRSVASNGQRVINRDPHAGFVPSPIAVGPNTQRNERL